MYVYITNTVRNVPKKINTYKKVQHDDVDDETAKLVQPRDNTSVHDLSLPLM